MSYVYSFQGIYGMATPATGLDPNYQPEYGGDRREGGSTIAAYGTYRRRHLRELGRPASTPELPPWAAAGQIPRPLQGSLPSRQSASSM